jgi:hypothetical protein
MKKRHHFFIMGKVSMWIPRFWGKGIQIPILVPCKMDGVSIKNILKKYSCSIANHNG